MTAMFGFNITIKGRGGHGAAPHQCVDALETGCQVASALQRIVSRKINPMSPAVITVGQFQAGTAFNVIPETADLGGTARTFDKATWKRWPEIIETIVKGVCDSMGAGYETAYDPGYPPVINEPDRVVVPEKTMGGEDISFFLEKAKGCFFCLGAGNDACAGIHSPRFDFNEKILSIGVKTYCRAALGLLGDSNVG